MSIKEEVAKQAKSRKEETEAIQNEIYVLADKLQDTMVGSNLYVCALALHGTLRSVLESMQKFSPANEFVEYLAEGVLKERVANPSTTIH